MADDLFEQEVEAIKATLRHLAPLSGPARERVIAYVLNALDVPTNRAAVAAPDVSRPTLSDPSPTGPEVGDRIQDIRSLREAKDPQTANEMAALVAYYLQEHAPLEERKEAINTADLERYFKVAPYPLPSKISNTLSNAAGAGYLDSLGGGKYKLNPVGYNLVVHGLPSGEGSRVMRKTSKKVARKTPAKKAVSAKVPVKKAVGKKAAAKKSAS